MITYEQKKNKQEMRQQLVVFLLMIFLTIIAFLTVYFEFSATFVAPFILLLAGVQVAFQLTYFMHLKERDYGVIWLFLSTGAFIAFVTVLAFVTIIWW